MSLFAGLFASDIQPAPQLTDGDGWMSILNGGFGGAPSTAGVNVSQSNAMTISAVYRAVMLISNAVAMLPLVVYRKDGDSREEVPDHPVAEVLRRPNDLMKPIDLRRAAQMHAMQYAGAYLEIQRSKNGVPIALWPLLPDRTAPHTRELSDGSRDLVYRTRVNGRHVDLATSDVCHVRQLTFDGINGYSVIGLAREGLSLSKALERFGAKFFGNDAISGGFLEHPGRLSPQAMKNILDSLEMQGGLDNAHRIKILAEGMKFNRTMIAPEDAQFLLTRTFQISEVARWYGLPLHLLSSQEKSTSWGSGISEMSLGFLIYTVQPWLVDWEQEFNFKLFTQAEQRAGFYVKHNVNALLRASPQVRSGYYTAARNGATGWMSRNEVRALEELNPDDVEDTEPTAAMGGVALTGDGSGEALPSIDDDEEQQ